MQFKAIFYLIFIIVLSIVHQSICQQCNQAGVRKFDTTVAKLLTLGGSGRRFPENKGDELKKYCDDSAIYLKDIDKYRNKCMKSLSKQVTGVVTYTMKNTINNYCKKDSKKLTELLSGTPCANSAKKEFDTCYTNLIDAYMGAINADDKKKMGHICCEYHHLFDCIKEKGIKVKNCNEAKLEVISYFIKDIFNDAVELICGDWTDGSDKCDKLGRAPKKTKSQRRTKSYMVPMIDLISSLPDA